MLLTRLSPVTPYTVDPGLRGVSAQPDSEGTGVIIEADMEVEFTGDVEPMRDLAEAAQTAIDADGPLENYPVVRMPSWAVTSRKPAGYFF